MGQRWGGAPNQDERVADVVRENALLIAAHVQIYAAFVAVVHVAPAYNRLDTTASTLGTGVECEPEGLFNINANTLVQR
jgi:hypothetical protein